MAIKLPCYAGYIGDKRQSIGESTVKCSYKGGREIPVSEPPKGHMKATRVSLMRSERGKNGMIYTEISAIE